MGNDTTLESTVLRYPNSQTIQSWVSCHSVMTCDSPWVAGYHPAYSLPLQLQTGRLRVKGWNTSAPTTFQNQLTVQSTLVQCWAVVLSSFLQNPVMSQQQELQPFYLHFFSKRKSLEPKWNNRDVASKSLNTLFQNSKVDCTVKASFKQKNMVLQSAARLHYPCHKCLAFPTSMGLEQEKRKLPVRCMWLLE